MALETRWLYPPDWDETYPGMGEAVNNHAYGPRRGVFYVQKYWAATEDDTKTRLIDISELRGPGGKEVQRLVVEKVRFQMFGVNVRFYWETAPADVEILSLGGTGVVSTGTIEGPFVDQRVADGTDGTGDLLFSTVDGASKDSIAIQLWLRFKTSGKPGTVEKSDGGA